MPVGTAARSPGLSVSGVSSAATRSIPAAPALARQGAETILVAGPTREPDPPGVRVVHVVTAREMLRACEAALLVSVPMWVIALALLAIAVALW